MVGGGKDSFIGAIHRMAANLDGHIQLVCGAFSSNEEKSKESGQSLYLPANRVYTLALQSGKTMARVQRALAPWCVSRRS